MKKPWLTPNNGIWYKLWEERGPDGRPERKKESLRDESGKLFRVVYNSKGEATNRDDAVVLLDRSLKMNGEKVSSKTPMAQAIIKARKRWETQAKPLKPETIRSYIKDISLLAKFLPPYVEDITEDHIIDIGHNLGEYLKKDLKPISRIDYLKSLSAFFVALVKERTLTKNPVIGYGLSAEGKIVEPFIEKQILDLIEGAKGAQSQYNVFPYYTLLMVALQMGMRLMEYVHFRWQHIDWKNQQYNIFQDSTFDPKYSKARTIYIPKISFELLKKIRQNEGHVFLKPTGKPLDAHLNRDFLDDIFKASGIKLTENQDKDLHQFRKTFASWRLACGQPPYRLMYDLGHSSMDTLLKHYANRVSNPSKRMMEIFGDFR